MIMKKNDSLLVVSADNVRWASWTSRGVKKSAFNRDGRVVLTVVDALVQFLRSFGYYGYVVETVKFFGLCYQRGDISRSTFYAAVYELLGRAFGYTAVATPSSKNYIVCNLTQKTHYFQIL